MAAVLLIAHAPLASALRGVAGHCFAEKGHLFEAVDTASGQPDYRARTDNTVGDGTGVTLVLVKL